ncbi:hypothetical protein LTR85_002490 [Meristemomyces frigidus]|nr:hypothetical protein LTR85_002490 [Meristemomyces frigidus]
MRNAAEPTVRLITTSGVSPYATLSYCWGGDQLTKTTKANSTQYEAQIQTALLPQTISDAMTVTRGIGLRYLWIDAYCIVQDEEEDKARQISQMLQVYRGFYVTIVSAKAGSAADGFLAPREAYRPVKMNVRWDDTVYGEAIAVRRSDEAQGHRLFTRGWTLQEVRLSARVLITWFRLVGEYTKRDLSVESDKLLAIAALAEDYANTMPLTEYLAGMWRDDLLHQLFRDPRAFKKKATRPTTYRAPSWSWASLDGEMSLNNGNFNEPTCELIDAHVTLRNPEHRFGQVLGGVLQLRGNIKHLTWTSSSEYARGDEWPLDSEVSLWGLELFRKPDLRESSVEEDEWIRDDRYYFSQALVLDANSDGTYRRVGTMYVTPQDPLPAWFNDGSNFEEVTIV